MTASGSSSTSSRRAVELGRVGRSHGLDGSFYVTRPLPGLLFEGARLVVAGARRGVERRAGTDAKPILRLEGVGSREAVEALRGETVWMRHADLPRLPDGEFYEHELVGCRVTDGTRQLGTVTALVPLPTCEALEVGDALIPMVGDAVRSVDVRRKRIDVDASFLG